MLSLGLPTTEAREFADLLARTCEVKTTVQILDNEHNIISTVSQMLMDGQVNGTIPASGEVSRTVTLTFLDPGGSLALSSNSPSDGAMYLDRMIRVVFSMRGSRWFDTPVFTGPIIKVDRDGDFVTVEAHGKERFALGDAYSPGTRSGLKTTTISVLLGMSGESSRYISLPSSRQLLPKRLSIARDSQPWVLATKVNRSLTAGRILYYDGRGVCRSVAKPSRSSFTVSNTNGMLLSDPQISYSTDDMKNVVRVTGGKPKGSKTAVVGVAKAPSSSSMNAYRIGRNGKPVWRALFEENGDLRTTAAATAHARDLLEDYLLQVVDVTFTCLPIPHLEPYDLITVKTSAFTRVVRVKSFSMSLTTGAMTIGYQQKLTKLHHLVGKK